MLKKIFFLLLLLIAVISDSWSQPITIKGKAPTYAGDLLLFSIYEDLVVYHDTLLRYWVTEHRDYKNLPLSKSMVFPGFQGVYKGPYFIESDTTFEKECRVAEDGTFEFKFAVDRVRYAHINLQAYEGYLFLEPGKDYEIILPPKKGIELKDKLNPYFKPVKFYFQVKNREKPGLNYYIQEFEILYDSVFLENAVKIFQHRRNTQIEQDIKLLKERFKEYDHPYFQNFTKYRFANLRYLALNQSPDKIIETYFSKQSVLINNLAYMELLVDISEKYLLGIIKEANDPEFSKSFSESGNLFEIKHFIQKYGRIYNDTLQETILLKGIYDGYYNNTFSKSELLNVLKLIVKQTSAEINRHIAAKMHYSATKLMPGRMAPHFELFDEDSVRAKLNLFRGKYLYLNFFSSKSYSCIQDLPVLQKIYDKHKDKLEIITVSVDEDFQNTLEIAEKKDYTWTFLRYSKESDILEKYNVKAFPTYYLIDPGGQLALSPAPAPDREFEAKFFQVWNNRKRQQMRGER